MSSQVFYVVHEISTCCLVFQEDELISQCMSPSTAGVNSFKLHDRAKHVYSEAARVLKFKSVCEEKPANAIQVRWLLLNAFFNLCCTKISNEIERYVWKENSVSEFTDGIRTHDRPYASRMFEPLSYWELKW